MGAADATARPAASTRAAATADRFVRPPIVVYATGKNGNDRHWSYLIFGRLNRTPQRVGRIDWDLAFEPLYTRGGSGSAGPTRFDSRRRCFMDFASDDPHFKLRIRRPFPGRRIKLTTRVDDGVTLLNHVRLRHDERIIDDIWATRHYGRLLGCRVR